MPSDLVGRLREEADARLDPVLQHILNEAADALEAGERREAKPQKCWRCQEILGEKTRLVRCNECGHILAVEESDVVNDLRARVPSEAAVVAVRELVADNGIRTGYRNDGPNVWLCESCYTEVPQWDRKGQRNIPCPDPFPHHDTCPVATLLREWPAVAEVREGAG